MEAKLLAWDQTDLADDNGRYLMSRPLDIGRERIPDSWNGESREVLLGRMEKVALEYGMYRNLGTRVSRPCLPCLDNS